MKYAEIGKRIGELVEVKNEQYGSSFKKSGEFLKILYPDGVNPEDYDNMLLQVRMFDKQMRIANGNESDENAFQDIVGYGILGTSMSDERGGSNS